MRYFHQDQQGNPLGLPVGKVVCVGQNYLAHRQEMQGAPVSEPILFMKPATSLVALDERVTIPSGLGTVHHELELAVLIDKRLTRASTAEAAAAIWGYGAALDLTLRDLQARLKAAGHPWERAKAFDGACPISGFVPGAAIDHPQNLSLSLCVNGKRRQQGNTGQMLRTTNELLVAISAVFTLQPGDVILTGTPAGVGALQPGDQLLIDVESLYHGALWVDG